MADGFAALDAQIARLRALPKLAREAAPEAALAVEDELKRQIASGTSPDGEAWAPRKEDGGRPLATAAKSLAVVAVGTRIFARLRGHVARHHRGIAKGGVERRILPTKGIPPAMARAIKGVLVRRFKETMGGG